MLQFLFDAVNLIIFSFRIRYLRVLLSNEGNDILLKLTEIVICLKILNIRLSRNVKLKLFILILYRCKRKIEK